MTSHKEHIQTLIAEIDSVLQRTNPRLPWVMSGEVAQQRQILERVRNYLVSLQQTLPASDGFGQSGYANPWADGVGTGAASQAIAAPGEMAADLTPYQMMQAILRDVGYLRANVGQLPVTPPPPPQPQLTAELVQVLMGRLQENLSRQIAQTLDSLRNQPPAPPGSPMLSGGFPPVPVPPQYEQLQAVRSRSDQMLVNLDASLNVVFESLQRNIQAYQDSLSQGLERMYNTGQQTEYTFKLLLEQLVHQLKQDTLAHLRTAQVASSMAPAAIASPPATDPVTPPSPAKLEFPQETAPASDGSRPSGSSPLPNFPYAGTEFLSTEISGTDLTTPPVSLEDFLPSTAASEPTPLDAEIEAWLQAVSAVNQDAAPSGQVTAAVAVPEVEPLDLSDLALDVVDSVLASPVSEARVSAVADAAIADRSATPPDAVGAISADLLAPDEEDTTDIDAALKLLEDISTELESAKADNSMAEAEAQLEQILGGAADSVRESATLPDDAQDELDEFYQSLFGSELEGADAEADADIPAILEETLTPAIAPPEPAITSEVEADFAAAIAVPAETSDSEAALMDQTLELETALLESLLPPVPDLGQEDLGLDLGDDASARSPITDPVVPAAPTFDLEFPSDISLDATPLNLELPADLFADLDAQTNLAQTAIPSGRAPENAPLDLAQTSAPSDLADGETLDFLRLPDITELPTSEPMPRSSIDDEVIARFNLEGSPPAIAIPDLQGFSLDLEPALPDIPTLETILPEPPTPEITIPEITIPEAIGSAADEGLTLASPEAEDALFLGEFGTQITQQDTPLLLDLPADLGGIDTPAADLPTSPAVESFALEPDKAGSLSDLFQSIPDTTARSIPAEPPGIRGPVAPTARSYGINAQDVLLADDLFGATAAESDDHFTRAADDEVLLPPNIEPEKVASLEFDALTLSSLSEDLSNLESGAAPVGQPEFTLDDFAVDVAPTQVVPTEPPINLNLEALTEPNRVISTSAFYEASPAIADVTVEGFSELFGDSTPSASPSLPPVTSPAEAPLPFTLEGTSSLFEAAAPLPSQPVSPPNQVPGDLVAPSDWVAPTTPTPPPVVNPWGMAPDQGDVSPFTLDGMNDLFGDPPTAIAPASPSTPVADAASAETYSPLPLSVSNQDMPMTLEGMDDLFGAPDPAPVAPPSTVPPREIPPFKPELFKTEDAAEPMPPFQLEQLDNLFVDTPANAAGISPSSGEAAIAPSPSIADKQSLDAAFERVLGTPPPSAPGEASRSAQKKNP